MLLFTWFFLCLNELSYIRTKSFLENYGKISRYDEFENKIYIYVYNLYRRWDSINEKKKNNISAFLLLKNSLRTKYASNKLTCKSNSRLKIEILRCSHIMPANSILWIEFLFYVYQIRAWIHMCRMFYSNFYFIFIFF